MNNTLTPPNNLQILAFSLAGENYGIPILKVKEIQAQAPITRIPRSPDYMPGVINLRGAIVPIIDLRTRFSLGDPPEDIRQVMVVVEVMGRTLGMRVDAVSDVLDLQQDQLKAPPEWGDGAIGREFIQALAPVPQPDGSEQMVILVDLDLLLSRAEMQAVEDL